MEKNNKKDVLKILGATGTRDILEFLNEHGTAQYKQLLQLVTTATLNNRLRELLISEMISYHSERTEKKKEWYELTEKGRAALKHARALINLT